MAELASLESLHFRQGKLPFVVVGSPPVRGARLVAPLAVEPKIVWRVVARIAVHVIHQFMWFQRPPKALSHNQAVFKDETRLVSHSVEVGQQSRRAPRTRKSTIASLEPHDAIDYLGAAYALPCEFSGLVMANDPTGRSVSTLAAHGANDGNKLLSRSGSRCIGPVHAWMREIAGIANTLACPASIAHSANILCSPCCTRRIADRTPIRNFHYMEYTLHHG